MLACASIDTMVTDEVMEAGETIPPLCSSSSSSFNGNGNGNGIDDGRQDDGDEDDADGDDGPDGISRK